MAMQVLTLIEDGHRHDLIYRGIKPDKNLIGTQVVDYQDNLLNI